MRIMVAARSDPIGKCAVLALVLFAMLLRAVLCNAEEYETAFSTYIGGALYEQIRDIFSDSEGNVYVTGGTTSRDFPTTPGAYQRRHAGMFDIFVTKLNRSGKIVWSTFVGGKDYDRAYAIEVDRQGFVYVAGRGGRHAPITPGVVQETFKGQWHGGPYKSDMNAYLFKLSPDGSKLLWATFFGTGEMFRDIDIDAEGNVYGVWHDPLNARNPYRNNWRQASWFARAFQKEPRGGAGDFGVVKISYDGTRCLWATYLTGSGKEGGAGSVRIGKDGNVYVETWTFSNDMPTTDGAHDRSYNGRSDYYIAKLSSDGSSLIYGTYLGGTGDEIHSTHNLAVDRHGNAYVSVWTSSTDFPTTSGVFQRSYNGGSSDWGVAKFSPNGALLASTLIGGSEGENPDGIYVDSHENVFLAGSTHSLNFPVTVSSRRTGRDKAQRGAVIQLSTDFSRLVFAHRIDGNRKVGLRTLSLGRDGAVYIAGESNSDNWPSVNAAQSHLAGQADGIIAKFMPLP